MKIIRKIIVLFLLVILCYFTFKWFDGYYDSTLYMKYGIDGNIYISKLLVYSFTAIAVIFCRITLLEAIFKDIGFNSKVFNIVIKLISIGINVVLYYYVFGITMLMTLPPFPD